MIRKTTIREIKQSFGRYFAILAIVALGVALFSGLKIIKSVMVESANQYLKEAGFYDYRLLSTLGFEDEDVAAVAAKEEVRAAEGSVSADILFVNAKGNESVIKAHTLLDNINGVVLTAGRLPERADECVVDSNLYNESAIGSKIILSDNNTEDDLEMFAYKEYTITGIVQSSYYIQYERGNTSLGNGMVSGFMYLLPEGFDTDYYTEIFIKFDEDYKIYSEEYDSYIDAKEPVWEQYCEALGERRYQAILDEANEKLSDAKAELSEKKAEAEEELSDAKQELTDAETEIADGEAELTDGEEKLADGEKELADAEKTIAEKETELLEAKQEIADNEALLAEKKKEYEDGMTAYTDGKAEVEKKEKELTDALAQITAGEAVLAQTQAGIDAMVPVYPADVVAKAQAQLDEQKAELAAQKTLVENGLSEVASADRELNAAYVQLFAGGVQIEEAQKELEDAKTQIAEGEAELSDAKEKLADSRAELTDAKAEIEENKEKLEDAKMEVADGWSEYHDAYAEFQEEIADAEAELADAEEEIADIEKPDTYVLGRDTNIGYVCYDNDSSIVDGIANVFPVFFFLVAALVCITTMNRMVEEQRTQIGVLKALGYKESTIMGKYLFYSGSAAFLGCVIGYFAGTYGISLVIWTAYGIMYRLGDMIYVFDVTLAVIVLVCSLACSMGATYFSCRHELREVAAALMRPKAPKAGKRVFLEKIPFIWKRLKFLDKVSVRNVIRYKKRFFMMVIGISGCTGLLVTGFGIMDSITHVAEKQFEEIQLYDVGISMKDGVKDADAEEIEELQALIEKYDGSYLYVAETAMDFVTENHIKSVNLIVAEEPLLFGDFIDLHTEDGESIAYPGEGEAVICKKLADSYHLTVGDSFSLRNDNMKEIPLTVSGICENYIYNYVYVNPTTYEKYIGEPEYKGIYVNLPQDADGHEVSAAFMNAGNVTAVTVNADMLVRFSSMMGSMNYIVLVIIVFAAALAFIVLYNLNNINITERIREIATIKVLGFYKKETTSYVFRENLVLTAIGCLCGLFLGKLLHLYVMKEVNIDMISFDMNIALKSYLLSIAFTFFFNWVVNRIMTGKLEKINMAESLKSVD